MTPTSEECERYQVTRLERTDARFADAVEVGELENYLVTGHSQILMRKTIGLLIQARET